MAEIEAHTVLARGIGGAYTPLDLGENTAAASRDGIMHVRNSGEQDVTLTATEPNDDDGLGGRTVEITVPPGAARHVALPTSLADPATKLITYVVTGDVSGADAAIITRRSPGGTE